LEWAIVPGAVVWVGSAGAAIFPDVLVVWWWLGSLLTGARSVVLQFLNRWGNAIYSLRFPQTCIRCPDCMRESGSEGNEFRRYVLYVWEVDGHFLPAPILVCVMSGSRRSSETENWSAKAFW
jgi:hypothetical protein